MSGLAVRIGKLFKQIQKLVHREDFVFSFDTLQGVRIAEMSSCATVFGKYVNQDKTDKNRDLSKKVQDIYILEELVNKKARVLISKQQAGRLCFQKTEHQPDFKLDWSDVEVIPTKPIFEQIHLKKEDKDDIRVISSTVLTNRSKVSQWHKIETERQMLSACESFITKGCLIGGKIGIRLPAPDVLWFSAGFSLRQPQQNFDEENLARVGTDCIQIPKGATITVTIQSKEQRKEFDFTASIGVRGAVYALWYNQRTYTTNKLKISIIDIFRTNISEMITKDDNDTIYFEVRGRCKFKYYVEHEIIINST